MPKSMLKYAFTFSNFSLKPTLLICGRTKFNMLLVKVLHMALKTISLKTKVNFGNQKKMSNDISVIAW